MKSLNSLPLKKFEYSKISLSLSTIYWNQSKVPASYSLPFRFPPSSGFPRPDKKTVFFAPSLLSRFFRNRSPLSPEAAKLPIRFAVPHSLFKKRGPFSQLPVLQRSFHACRPPELITPSLQRDRSYITTSKTCQQAPVKKQEK